jgi:hypothetical protein
LPTAHPEAFPVSPATFGGRSRWDFICYTALLLALIAFAAIRFRLRTMPLERDEGEYAYMGQLILHGVPPYQLASNMKLPGTYAAYAAIMAVFGQTAAGIRLGMILVTSAAAFLVFLLGKYLYGTLAGTVAGVAYVFLAARPGVLGIDGHATHFVVLMALAGTLVLLYALDSNKTGVFFASGLFLGLAFLMKQLGILFAVFAVFCWLWHEWKRPVAWRNAVIRGGALLLGMLLPYGVMCAFLLRAGVFSKFWFWTWTYAREYGTITSFAQAWQNLKIALPWVVRPFVLWELVVIGLTAPLWSRFARGRGGFLVGFFVVSCLAVCPGLYFRPHYFILLLPAAALCVGVAVESVRQELQKLKLPGVACFPVVYFAVVYLMAFHGQWKTSFRLDPAAFSRKVHERQPYADAVTAADFIKSQAAPLDQIGILGSEPEICFYARLRCASSYLYMYPLTENQRFEKLMQDDLMRELESSRPRFLVYVDNELSWNWKPRLQENRPFFERAWSFAHNGYVLVDQVSAPDATSYPEHLWNDRPRFYVFERREDLAE